MDENIIIEPDVTYTFEIKEKTLEYYRFVQKITEWLKANMENLTDDKGIKIFSKVNTGYNENTLKSFGKKPVCDIHMNNIEFDTDFDVNKPIKAHSIIIFYLKGANDHAYSKSCELLDYLIQEFAVNTEFQQLEGVVRDTRLIDASLINQQASKSYGTLGTLELVHELY